MKSKLLISSYFFLLFPLFLSAQGKIEDYKRAYSLQKLYSTKVLSTDVIPEWIDSTHYFWYSTNLAKGKVFFLVNAQKQIKSQLFDAQKLAAELNLATKKEIDTNNLGISITNISTNLDTMNFGFDDNKWSYNIKKNILTKKEKDQNKPNQAWNTVDTERTGKPVISPDKKWLAYVKDHNLYIKEVKTGLEMALSKEGTQKSYYSAYPHWSPDSKKIAVMRIDEASTRKLYLIESSPKDQLQPKLHSRDYVKPGDTLPFRVPVIFEIETLKQHICDTQLFPNQYTLRGISWLKDSKSAMIEYNQRGHQLYRVLEINAQNGQVKTIIEETSSTFVNYNRYYKKLLKGEQEIIWMSERDNWNHLYLYDRKTGTVKNQITRGAWYVRQVIHVDEEKREIIFSANGMMHNEDPYYIRYYRIGFDGKNLSCLTPEKGTHQAWFSKDKKYFVDVYSTLNKAPISLLRSSTDGKILQTLEKADIDPLQEAGWRQPEQFVAKGRDGKTDIWGVIVRPSNFDPNKKYPVIEYIYAGPGGQYAPNSFFAFNRNMTILAELGFVVVQMDGMGTSFRSKSFEDVIFKNLKDAGFPDRIAWIKAAAAKYPSIDADNVGIFGASAGGQEAMWAVLFHPEHYKAAYASCGCHDNRMDKIWWNEQWMSYPIGDEYAACSNVNNAHLLDRPLMLVVGELDDNVDPSSTLQVADALIKANKDFELVVLPGVGHTMGNDYGEHKRFDFFVKNLMKQTPPDWKKVNEK
jgi:dipeptidyl aminopeptidase/acylaminoacyl peptidase